MNDFAHKKRMKHILDNVLRDGSHTAWRYTNCKVAVYKIMFIFYPLKTGKIIFFLVKLFFCAVYIGNFI